MDKGDAVPLVFALHGMDMTMYSMLDFSRWREIVDAEGFVLVLPISTNKTNSALWGLAPVGTADTHRLWNWYRSWKLDAEGNSVPLVQ